MNLAPASEPHVLVVDDDPRLRALLQRYLQDNGYRVTVAADAAEARQRLQALAFDALILDVMMPGETGFELTAHLRKSSDVAILLLTARGGPEDRIAGLEIGADDYLAKPFEPKELILRLNALLRRARPAPSALKTVFFGSLRFDLERGELMRDDTRIPLTTAELQLMRVLAGAPGEPFSRLDLCARTGTSLERTIDVQVTRLRRKIETDPKMPLFLQTVRGVGYVLVPDRVA